MVLSLGNAGLGAGAGAVDTGGMTRIGLVLGAGGVIGAAFHDGVLRAITDATGWDPRDAEIIVGTSAGSHVGAALRAGRSPEGPASRGVQARSEPEPPAARRYAPSSPRLLVRGLARPGSVPIGAMLSGAVPAGRQSLRPMVDEVNRQHPGGWPADPLWIPGVRLRDGARVVFGREGAPATDVGRAVAASCAIPGWFSPVTIDGERYVDGGAHSTTNLDLLAGRDIDLVVVSAPMGVARGVRSAAAALQARGYMRLRLGREAARVRRSGTAVIAFSPTAADLEVMGWNAMAQGRRRSVVEQAHRSASRRLADPRWREELAPLAA